MAKLRKLLLTNSHSTNMGDAAVVLAMIAQLRALGSVGITVHCADEVYAARTLRPQGISHSLYAWPMFTQAAGFADFMETGIVICGNFLSALAYRLLGAEVFLFNGQYRGQLMDFFTSDVVISVGGGFISAEYGYLRPYCDLLLAKLLGKRTVIYGQSIGPFHGFVDSLVSRFVLGGVDLILLRDERSAAYLREIGITGFHVTADLAFSFPVPKAARGLKRVPTVVLCPRKWEFSQRKTADGYVRFFKKLAGALMENGARVVVLPTTPEDLVFHSTLREILPPGAEFETEVLPPDALAQSLASADFIVSSRMHPLVLGSLSATPFFAVGWEFKLDEIARMFACPGCSLNAASLDDAAVELVLDAFHRKDELRRGIALRLPALRDKAMANAGILAENLQAWGYETRP